MFGVNEGPHGLCSEAIYIQNGKYKESYTKEGKKAAFLHTPHPRRLSHSEDLVDACLMPSLPILSTAVAAKPTV